MLQLAAHKYPDGKRMDWFSQGYQSRSIPTAFTTLAATYKLWYDEGDVRLVFKKCSVFYIVASYMLPLLWNWCRKNHATESGELWLYRKWSPSILSNAIGYVTVYHCWCAWIWHSTCTERNIFSKNRWTSLYMYINVIKCEHFCTCYKISKLL